LRDDVGIVPYKCNTSQIVGADIIRPLVCSIQTD
jgi:hypothetical protein